ncbi:MAG TPA: AAA family ATPase [Chloroflexota bacterium]|jgi:predicted kinase|nr:AAA family ATPase [Chloroflexota bacterium]
MRAAVQTGIREVRLGRHAARPLSRPPLVVLSGSSCSGKSTLAPRLVDGLGLPLVAKDDLKETLYDVLGTPPDREASRRLGLAAMRLLYRSAAGLLEAGVGAIVEANFWRGRCEGELAPLVARAAAVRVHCQASRELLVRRQLARAHGEAPRHAGHVAHTPAAPLLALLERPDELTSAPWPDYDPPDLDTPLLVVDTTDGYAPDVPEVVAWIGRRLADRPPAADRPTRSLTGGTLRRRAGPL